MRLPDRYVSGSAAAVTTHIVPREMDTMVLLPAVLQEEANGLLGDQVYDRGQAVSH